METIQKTMDEMCAEAINAHEESESVETLKNQLAQREWLYKTELNELKHNFRKYSKTMNSKVFIIQCTTHLLLTHVVFYDGSTSVL